MYQSARAVTLNAPIAKVWDIVGDFHGLPKFHPLIKETKRENGGLWRRDMFAGVDAGSLEERLHYSDQAKCYSYRSLNAGGGAWPIDSYFGKFKVWSRGPERTGVLWSAQMIPTDPEAGADSLTAQLVENQTVGLGGLVDHFGGAPLPVPEHAYAASALAHLNTTPDQVWSFVGDFFQIADWITTVETVKKVSNGRRFVKLKDADQIDVETELFRDDAARTLSYDSRLEPDSAYPCDDYIANLKVWPRADGTAGLVWSGQFTPTNPDDETTVNTVSDMMTSEYRASLEGLVQQFGGNMVSNQAKPSQQPLAASV
ncbi:SRPBCC family protein [Gymnodinialimonas sp. 2305UL16-5]|uniref:SRPBCC family protein n=1 Tax=Gymnodinialimonas mytili TaxID=3126503 RepID=UPI0030A536B0